MQNARLDELQTGIKIARRNINGLRYADNTILMAECREELKSLLMRVEDSEKKTGLKFNIKKYKTMAFSPTTSWQIEGENVEGMTDFLFLSSKITVHGDCSHEIRKHLLLERKAMTNLESILESKDITLLTKGRVVKAMVFPVVTYGCESWTTKKAEH